MIIHQHQLLKLILLISLVIFTVAISLYFLQPILNEENVHQTQSFEILASGFIVPEPVDVRVAQADSVALVTIETVGAARWNTADGKAPSQPIQELIQLGMNPVIFRPVMLRVEQYLKNPQPEITLTIHQVGGEIDGIRLLAPEGIEFQEGTQAIVFLSRQQSPSPVAWDLYTAYVIDGDTAYSKWDERSLSVNELLQAIAVASK
ncbi:MAG TPA: hypothetical protein VJM08_15235, partial [Anaerolineales bacterium]|nr:hypothetical protein [Anaerolineales bacterium]